MHARRRPENRTRTPEKRKRRSRKGAVSIYGIGRFPVTVYNEQWLMTFGHSLRRAMRSRKRKVNGLAKKKISACDNTEVIALLERYQCPTPLHTIRTQFMGSIASPAANISPMQTIKQLWGGELPACDTMEDLNHLFSVLVSGLWNPLTAHQMPDNPFKLTSPDLPITDQGLHHFTLVRKQEIEGFVEGMFSSHKTLDLPERAHRAVEVLSEIRAMLSGIVNLLNDSSKPAEVDELKALVHNIKEISKIVEMEMNSAIQSSVRAREQGAQSRSVTNPIMH